MHSSRVITVYAVGFLIVCVLYLVFSGFWLFNACFQLVRFKHMLVVLGAKLQNPTARFNRARAQELHDQITFSIGRIEDMWWMILAIFVVSSCLAFVGMGLFRRRGWARMTMLLVAVAALSFFVTTVVLNVVFPGEYTLFAFSDSLLTLVFSVITLLFLSHPNVKRQFIAVKQQSR
ncbi:MAG: hypothetical protein JW844_07295 [Candidatus Omnitrophica bacterium]|nr:hypothetical protein [Candidatus Omnitrophota bacterium]